MGAKDAKETTGNIKSFSLEGSSGDEYFDKRCGTLELALSNLGCCQVLRNGSNTCAHSLFLSYDAGAPPVPSSSSRPALGVSDQS